MDGIWGELTAGASGRAGTLVPWVLVPRDVALAGLRPVCLRAWSLGMGGTPVPGGEQSQGRMDVDGCGLTLGFGGHPTTLHPTYHQLRVGPQCAHVEWVGGSVGRFGADHRGDHQGRAFL